MTSTNEIFKMIDECNSIDALKEIHDKYQSKIEGDNARLKEIDQQVEKLRSEYNEIRSQGLPVGVIDPIDYIKTKAGELALSM